MKLIKMLSNAKGFSLVEVMITAGLMGGLAFVFMHLSDRIIDSERKMMDMIDMNELVTKVRYQLNDSVACNKTLSVQKYKSGYRLPSEMTTLFDRNGQAIVTVNENVGKIKVEKIQGVLDLQSSAILENVKMYNIILHLKGPGKNAKSIPFKLTVPILTDVFEDKTTRFLYCDSFTNGVAHDLTNVLMERMCKSFEAPYDKKTGLCDFSKAAGVFKPNEETVKLLQKILSEQLLHEGKK